MNARLDEQSKVTCLSGQHRDDSITCKITKVKYILVISIEIDDAMHTYVHTSFHTEKA